MMKEICTQCLQLQRDPQTGTETVVFSGFNQDQEVERVDFPALHRRLSQNSVQEKAQRAVDRSLAALCRLALDNSGRVAASAGFRLFARKANHRMVSQRHAAAY